MKLEAFVADRRERLENNDALLRPVVLEALTRLMGGASDWDVALLAVLGDMFTELVETELPGASPTQAREEFLAAVRESLARTTRPSGEVTEAQRERIVYWLSTYVLGAASDAAARLMADDGQDVVKTWLTMLDRNVRAIHRPLHGQAVEVGATFDVAGTQLSFPGQPLGPPEVWIQCRCVLAIGTREAMAEMTAEIADTVAAAATITVTLDEDVAEEELEEVPEDPSSGEPVPWHGVLAPEGVPTGDRRMFAEGAMRHRDLPLPLLWQRTTDEGHDGSVVVGRIDRIWREGNLIKAEGVFAATDEGDEVVMGIVDGYFGGVSVDVDDATLELRTPDGIALSEGDMIEPDTLRVITDGRISAATMVSIPAFAEAWIALGPWEAEGEPEEEVVAAAGEQMAITDKAWDGSSSRFTVEQWRRACVLDTGQGDEDSKSRYKLPIREPNGDLNRNAVHNAAARFNQVEAPEEAKAKAKASLRGAYRQLGEEVPDVVASALTEQLRRGPGWVTHPKETSRLHHYWVRGEGAAKIGWGTPGSFNRCRTQLAKYLPARFLTRTCAEWYHDATGIWPGRKRGDKASVDPAAPMVTLLAAASTTFEASAFADPQLSGPTPLTVTPDGRVFGHVATWGTCHIGVAGVCTTPPTSKTQYAYFHTGSVTTTDGDVAVGALTVDTNHAALGLRSRPAAAHYDNTGTAWAWVRAGEDDHGIWVAGVVNPAVDELTLTRAKASALSGDWRKIGNNLEMVAALSVNVPGFPIPATALAASAGEQTALVASGVVTPRDETDYLKQVISETIRETLAAQERQDKASQLKSRLRTKRVDELKGRV